MAKVLIVDDSSLIRSMLEDIARQKNLEIIEATNVDEAIDFYINEQPSLVFMDIILQNDGRTGIDALKAIKEYDSDARVVIVTSIGGNEDVMQECIESGAIDYITKPFSRGKILETIEDYITE
ncbi:MAG: response regulator [Candidatus Woesearchaeota archaeon]